MKQKDRADETATVMGPGMSKFSTTTSTFFKAIAAENDTKDQWNAFGLKYAPVMESHAIAHLGATPEEAQEAVQNTFLALCKCPKALRRPPNGRFRFWIVSVLKNRLLKIWRRKERDRSLHDDLAHHVTDAEYEASERNVRRAFVSFLQEDLYRLLKASRLPDSRLTRQKFEIWLARVYEDRSLEDVAQEYNICTKTVTRYVQEVQEFLASQGDELFAEFEMI